MMLVLQFALKCFGEKQKKFLAFGKYEIMIIKKFRCLYVDYEHGIQCS